LGETLPTIKTYERFSTFKILKAVELKVLCGKSTSVLTDFLIDIRNERE
jgi:hypothetical protein